MSTIASDPYHIFSLFLQMRYRSLWNFLEWAEISSPHPETNASKTPLLESTTGQLSREEDGKGAPRLQETGILGEVSWVNAT